jgi:transposase
VGNSLKEFANRSKKLFISDKKRIFQWLGRVRPIALVIVDKFARIELGALAMHFIKILLME